jgi:hypothetical protein
VPSENSAIQGGNDGDDGIEEEEDCVELNAEEFEAASIAESTAEAQEMPSSRIGP